MYVCMYIYINLISTDYIKIIIYFDTYKLGCGFLVYNNFVFLIHVLKLI